MRDASTCDVLVVGAGPAGIAAACCAAESGRSVCVVDDNPGPGGQIWRGAGITRTLTGSAGKWLERFEASGARRLYGAAVVDAPEPGTLLALVDGSPMTLKASRIILACGMRERFVPFPGWTLPQVVGVGGLQALVKSGLQIRGRRVLVAGSGPLLLAVADDLKQKGAVLVGIAEQAPFTRVARFGVSLLRHPDKLIQGAGIGSRLAGTRVMHNTFPWRAEVAEADAIRVRLKRGDHDLTLETDLLACGFGLVPNTELAAVMGCRMEGREVICNSLTQTSIAEVFAPALTATGSGGVDQSLLEGQIAGYAAADRTDKARALAQRSGGVEHFARSLDRAYALREELRELVDDETVICRCEDVRHATLQQYTGWKHAKLQTRCGMGPCQARTCGPAIEHLYGWSSGSLRAPVFPAPVGALVNAKTDPASEG